MKNLTQTFCGVLLLTIALFLLLALVSYNIDDPSFNHATNSEATNYLGISGAFIIDPILQSIGLGVIIPILFCFTGSIQFLRFNKPRLIIIRMSLILLLLPMFCALLAFIPAVIYKSYTSYGGFIGLYINEQLLLYINHTYVVGVCVFTTLIICFAAINISYLEWKKIGFFLVKCVIYTLLMLRWSIKYAIYSAQKKLQKNEFISNSQEIGEIQTETKLAPVIEKKIRFSEITKRKTQVQSSFKLDPGEFELPSANLLKEMPLQNKKHQLSEAALNQNSKLLQQVLNDFGVNGQISQINPGPVVTLYELEPSAGTKSSRVIGLADDISRSMSALSARIAVIGGKNALGIELPNAHRETVYLRELLESRSYQEIDAKLPLILGKNIGGEPVIADLAKMPHLLVAGTTGSGKSVAINTMILSLLYKLSPKECQFIMIDPKMLELSVYDGIPHLLTPVVTDSKKAVSALKWVVKEMENRYKAMSMLGVRNILGFNKSIEEAISKGEVLTKQLQTGFDQDGKPLFEKIEMPNAPLPYIVVIVDEMADLMIVAGKDIEGYIQRLAQMARAAGIHIIMATQRPSVDVITGVIKANFPTRISFQVTSKIDSRTILGEQGAEQLLGMGDMLYMQGGGRISRVHGPFVGDKEVESIVAFLKQQGTPKYRDEITTDDEEASEFFSEGADDLYSQAVQIVIRDKRPTTSYIQRCLKIGYNKAASLIEQMEKNGVLSSPNHMGKREILINE